MTAAAGQGLARTPARRKARQLAKYLRAGRPDYAYLKDVFRHLREELDVEVTRAAKKLPYVPTEAEIRAFYDSVWKARRAGRRHLDQDPAVHRRPGPERDQVPRLRSPGLQKICNLFAYR